MPRMHVYRLVLFHRIDFVVISFMSSIVDCGRHLRSYSCKRSSPERDFYRVFVLAEFPKKWQMYISDKYPTLAFSIQINQRLVSYDPDHKVFFFFFSFWKRNVLRDLSFYLTFYHLVFKVMHDEVSETENIRKNLSIERQIAEGCEMLLDVNQIFIRQGINHLNLTLMLSLQLR